MQVSAVELLAISSNASVFASLTVPGYKESSRQQFLLTKTESNMLKETHNEIEAEVRM